MADKSDTYMSHSSYSKTPKNHGTYATPIPDTRPSLEPLRKTGSTTSKHSTSKSVKPESSLKHSQISHMSSIKPPPPNPKHFEAPEQYDDDEQSIAQSSAPFSVSRSAPYFPSSQAIKISKFSGETLRTSDVKSMQRWVHSLEHYEKTFN